MKIIGISSSVRLNYNNSEYRISICSEGLIFFELYEELYGYNYIDEDDIKDIFSIKDLEYIETLLKSMYNASLEKL